MVKHFECVIKHIQILIFISSVWRICPIAVIELNAHASISQFGYPSAREAAGTLSSLWWLSLMHWSNKRIWWRFRGRGNNWCFQCSRSALSSHISAYIIISSFCNCLDSRLLWTSVMLLLQFACLKLVTRPITLITWNAMRQVILTVDTKFYKNLKQKIWKIFSQTVSKIPRFTVCRRVGETGS